MKIVLFGSPGSGKGTQAIMLGKHLNLKHISLGDILRGEVKRQSSLGQEVGGYMERGLLVPDELISRVLRENINADGFILDGYPRNLNQAKVLEQVLGGSGIDVFIYLDVDERIIEDRLSKRRVCKECRANYHIENMPPKKEGICDTCGSGLIRRKDDSPDVVKKRWEVFFNEAGRILDFYRSKDTLVEIDGRGDKNEIFDRIKKRLQ